MGTSSLSKHTSADEAIQAICDEYKFDEKEKQLLWKLRTDVFKIMRDKITAEQAMSTHNGDKAMSKSDAEKGLRNFNLNIYVNEKKLNCMIGKGGTLLILNIIAGDLEVEWNDLHGKIDNFSKEDVKKFKEITDKIGA